MARKDIAVGTKFERLTVLKRTDEKKHGCYMYLCRCSCNKEILVRSDMLRNGEVKSCGCLHDDLLQINVKKAYKKNFVGGTNLPKITNNKLQKNNTSGVKGVRWHKKMCKWQASITFKGKDYHLGYYHSIEEATKIRKLAEKELFGEFLKWYQEEYKHGQP